MDYRLTKKVVVDAGHGGVDSGASGNGIVEKDYNLKKVKMKYWNY
jgi:N-acetylmuramoyl-L-alanine amidase